MGLMTPSAVGVLADTPLAHALVYARNRRLTGRLELTSADERRAAITIWRGRITAVDTVPLGMCPGGFFGAVAYELGFIDSATLDATLLEIARTKRLHGEVLVERGAITTAQRDEALVEQVHRKVHHVFAFPDTTRYAFYDAPLAVGAEAPIAVDTLGPIWRGIRDHPPERFVAETVRRVGQNALRATGGGSARLPPAERALLESLATRPMTLDEMKRSTELPASRVELLAYLLVIARCVEAVSGARTHPSTGALPAQMPSGPLAPSRELPRASGLVRAQPHPASSARALAQKAPLELGVEGIRARAEAVEHLGAFEVLGLPDGASVEAARAAYVRLAKTWHPDRLPQELADVRPEVVRIFTRVMDAHRTLSDDGARQAYIDARKAGVRADPLPRDRVLREIEARMARSDLHAALALCEELLADDAEDADALALRAWAPVAGGASEDELRAALTALDRAVRLDRTCDRAVYLRGLAHKRLGDMAAAFRDFARAIQLDPKHVDAEREVRLFAMRARKGSGEHKLATSLLDAVARRK